MASQHQENRKHVGELELVILVVTKPRDQLTSVYSLSYLHNSNNANVQQIAT